MRACRSFGRTATIAVTVIGAMTIAGCGIFRPGTLRGAEDAIIYFTNESLDQVAVYAAGAGANVRLGTVAPGRTDTLAVPESFTTRGSITVFARYLARRETPSTGNIMIASGARLQLRLSSNSRTIVVLPAN